MKPPEAVLTQTSIYTEEKFEDEEDFRERTRSRFKRRERTQSESELTLESLIAIAKQHKDIYPMMVDTLKWYTVILEKDLPLYVSVELTEQGTYVFIYRQNKADLFIVLDKFVQQAALLDNMYGVFIIKVLICSDQSEL